LDDSAIHRRKSVRGFFAWAYDHDMASANPAASLQTPKIPDTLPAVLNETQAQQLMDRVDEDGMEARSQEPNMKKQAIALRDAAMHAAACVIFGRFGHPQAQILDGHLIQIHATLFPQRHQAFLDIAAVRPAGVCAQPSVGFQIGVESVQRIIETHANHLPLRLK